MPKRVPLSLAVLLLWLLGRSAGAAPVSVYELTPVLEAWASDPVLVAAVREQNARGADLGSVKRRDAQWLATPGIDAFMKSLLENPAARRLRELESSRAYFTETFLMDRLGANVAMTNRTSDYWQGDETKFIECFANGAGKIHIGQVRFDSSTQAYLVQVTVPVRERGSAIGALTVGINLDRLDGSR